MIMIMTIIIIIIIIIMSNLITCFVSGIQCSRSSQISPIIVFVFVIAFAAILSRAQMAADQIERAKSATIRSNVENLSLQDGDVPASVVYRRGCARCFSEPAGRRPLQRTSSMPGRIDPPSYGSALSLARRGPRLHRSPLAAAESQEEVVPLRRGPEVAEKADCDAGGSVAAPTLTDRVNISVRAASPAGSAGRFTTAPNALRRHLGGSTSFIFRRKRVLGVPVDENNVPQIDRAVSPASSVTGSPTLKPRKPTTTHVAATQGTGRQPIYARRFASLRLPPSGPRSTGTSAARHHQLSSTLLSPAAAANGSSDHRPFGCSYARMQLLQNIGKRSYFLSAAKTTGRQNVLLIPPPVCYICLELLAHLGGGSYPFSCRIKATGPCNIVLNFTTFCFLCKRGHLESPADLRTEGGATPLLPLIFLTPSPLLS